MKKSTFFFIALFLLIVASAAVRFFNSEKFSHFYKNNSSSFLGGIITEKDSNTLGEILVGKWNFTMEDKGEMTSFVLKGIVIYNSDSTFVRQLTYKRLSHSTAMGIAGGTVNGSWYVGNGAYWIEKTTSCNLLNSFGSDTSCDFFDGEVVYGTKTTNTINTKLVTLTDNKIEIVGKNFSNENDVFLTLTKSD